MLRLVDLNLNVVRKPIEYDNILGVELNNGFILPINLNLSEKECSRKYPYDCNLDFEFKTEETTFRYEVSGVRLEMRFPYMEDLDGINRNELLNLLSRYSCTSSILYSIVKNNKPISTCSQVRIDSKMYIVACRIGLSPLTYKFDSGTPGVAVIPLVYPKSDKIYRIKSYYDD